MPASATAMPITRSQPMRTATISLGYADGWPRRAAASAWRDGVELPFVGRVSMDSIILDISALPRGSLKAGDLVELIGPNQTVDDIAGARRHDRLRDPDLARQAFPSRLR